MHMLASLLFFLAQPFWQAKAPEEWSLQEIGILRSNSPWAQQAGPAPAVLVYLATAAPIEEAESELRVRSRSPIAERDPDYSAYITAHRDQNLVLGDEDPKALQVCRPGHRLAPREPDGGGHSAGQAPAAFARFTSSTNRV